MKRQLPALLRNPSLSLLRAVRRFPLPTLFVVLLTLKVLLFLHGVRDGSEHEEHVVLYYLASAALLATVTAVWGETQRSRRLRWAVTVATQFLWLGCTAYLYTQPVASLACLVGHGATVALMVAALPGLPYLRSHSELAFRRFCSRLVFSAFAAGLTGFCFFTGVTVLLLAMDPLFGVELSDRAVGTCFAVCFVLGAPLVFLARMPEPDALGQEQNAVGHLTRYAVRYVLNPLLCVYLLTLYVYAAFILLRWELPNGWVSGLVSTLMGGLVVAVYLYLPLRRTDGWTRDDVVARYGPALMLPLLLLMSVGIGRRLYDYGLTVRRLYLLTFNLWCYAACFYLIFTRSRCIKWLLLSPVVVLFAVSVGPWSLVETTQRVLTHEVKRALDGSGVAACPMDRTEYRHTLDAMSDETARYVNDKLAYLLDTYGQESVAAFIHDDVRPHDFAPGTKNEATSYNNYFRSDLPATLPGDYRLLVRQGIKTDITPADLRRDTARLVLTCTAPDGQPRRAEFDIPLQRLRDLDTLSYDYPAVPLLSLDGQACLLVEMYHLTVRPHQDSNTARRDNLTMEGILLLK